MRKSFFAVALIASMLAATTGCTTMGEKSLDPMTRRLVDQTIIDGKTTMEQVKAAYGEPGAKETKIVGGGQFWYYSMANHYVFGGKVKTLAVTFNDKGLVTSHQYDVY